MKIQEYGPQKIEPTTSVGMSMSISGERSGPILRPDTSGYKYRGGMAVANALTDVSAKMYEAERVEQLSEGRVNALTGYSELIHRMKTDPSVMNLTTDELLLKYDDESKKLGESLLGNVSNHKAKQALSLFIADTGVRGKIQTQDIGWNRQVDRGIAKMNDQGERLIDEVVQGMDPTRAMETFEINIAEMENVGYIGHTEAQRLRGEFNDKAGAVYIDSLIDIDPVGAVELLESEGGAPYLKGRLRASKLIAAKKMAKETIETGVEAKMINRFGSQFELMSDIVNNPNNWKELGITDSDQAHALDSRFRGLRNEQEHRNDRAESNHNKYLQRSDTEARILHAEGKLSFNQAKELYRSRKISESLFKEIENDLNSGGDGIGAKHNNPVVLGELNKMILYNPEDVEEYAARALRDNDLKGETYGSVIKQANNALYKRGLGKLDALKPGEMDKFNEDKNLRYGDATERYNALVGQGIDPSDAADMTISQYDIRRTASMLPAPSTLQGSKTDMASLEAAARDLVGQYKRKEILESEFNYQSGRIKDLMDIAKEHGTTKELTEKDKGRIKMSDD